MKSDTIVLQFCFQVVIGNTEFRITSTVLWLTFVQ